MGVQKNEKIQIDFRKSPPLVASFSFTDIIAGAGYVTFNGATSTNTNTDAYNYELMTPTLDVGNSSLTTSPTINERLTNVGSEVKFSTTTFNFTRTIKGDLYISFTNTSSDGGSEQDFDINVYKNDTEIGTATIKGAGTNLSSTKLVKIAISKTLFKKGDVLKIGFDGDTYTWVHHDPLNRDVSSFSTGGAGLGTLPAVVAATNTTQMRIYVPFELEV